MRRFARAILSQPSPFMPTASPALVSNHRGGAAPRTVLNASKGSARPTSAFILDPHSAELIYGEEERRKIAGLTQPGAALLTRENWRGHREILAETEIIFSGWGAPRMDEEFLRAAPRLRAVFYGAGSVRGFVTDSLWDRGIVVSSAYAANAVPVAEYTVAAALLSLRQFWQRSAAARQGEGWGDHTRPIPGSFRATIGLVSFGMIARKVAGFLRAFDLNVIVYCPYLTASEAELHGVERCSLDELFARADVVSVHTPVLTETIGLVTGRLVASMRADATLINTSRGSILNQAEVEAVLRHRPDLSAVLDVTDPEPPKAGCSLLTLPNVVVTSHIAGSHGRDCQRMGSYMLAELERYLNAQPLLWEVTRDQLRNMA